MLIKRLMLYIGVSLVLFISACSGPSTQEEIYDLLEEAVSLESGFAEQQNEITELEKQEREIFDQIVDLEMSEFDKIKELSEQAIGIIEERSDKINSEKDSINASQKEFEKTKKLIDSLEDPVVKEKANEMYNVMIERYEAYGIIHEAYTQSLIDEKQLYKLFQEEDVTQEDFTDQTSKVNNNYEKILEGNELFNAATVKYNDLKKEFYDLANLNVKYNEN